MRFANENFLLKALYDKFYFKIFSLELFFINFNFNNFLGVESISEISLLRFILLSDYLNFKL
jgi:hypothetical protein